jgi:hypothetical protein
MKHTTTILFLAIALAGCAGVFRAQRQNCYGATPARVGRDVPDEEFAYAHAIHRRVQVMRPMHRAAMLPTLFAWSPDVSDLAPGADCGADLAVESERELFRETPVRFSRLQIARARAISRGWAGRLSLMRLAELDDSEIAPYHAEPEERGTRPPRDALRRAALLGMHSGLVMNDADVRAYVLRTLLESDDAWEQLALRGSALVIVSDALWGHPARFEGPGAADARAILEQRLHHLHARIDGPPDRAELELAIFWLPHLGFYGARADRGREVREIASRIVERRGALRIAEGIDGGAIDLAIAARRAIAELDHPSEHVSMGDLEPPAQREVFAPHHEPWLEVVPWRDSASPDAEAARAAHLAQLEEDLASLRHFRPRCAVMRDMLDWATEEDARHLFDVFSAPLRTEGPIALSSEVFCRIGLLARIRGPIDPDRIGFLISLYDLSPERIGERDHSLDEHHPGIGYSIYGSLRPFAMSALASRPDLIADHAELRAFVPRIETQALAARADVDTHEAPAAVAVHALTRAWLEWAISSGDAAALDEARALVARWIAWIPERYAMPHTGAVYPGERTIHWLFTIGSHAARLGLTEPARAMIAAVREIQPIPILHATLDVIEYLLELGEDARGGGARDEVGPP